MKNAPTRKSSESVRDKRDYTLGTMPELCSTVRAAVLAELLSGQVMTGMNSVFAQSTTRLSAVIYALENEYGWVIRRQDIDVDTKDGRSTRIVGYYLDQATIQEAAARGSRRWIVAVKAARTKQKQHVRKSNQTAQVEAVRQQLRLHDPRQLWLWSGQ